MFHPSRNFEADCRKQPVCKLGFPQADPAGTAVPLQKSCSIAQTACDETYHCFRIQSICLHAPLAVRNTTKDFPCKRSCAEWRHHENRPLVSNPNSACTSTVVESCLVVLSKTSPLTAVPCLIESLDKQMSPFPKTSTNFERWSQLSTPGSIVAVGGTMPEFWTALWQRDWAFSNIRRSVGWEEYVSSSDSDISPVPAARS